jgi:hypothetical protein
MTQLQVQQAAQQQVAPLQQQAQLAIMQAAAAAAGGTYAHHLQGMGQMQGQGMPNQGMQNQGMQPMQAIQGMQVMQGLQGMQGGLQQSSGMQVQGIPIQPNMQAQGNLLPNPRQAQQRSNSVSSQSTMVNGIAVSRGVPGGDQSAVRPSAARQDKLATFRSQVQKMASMSEANREKLFATVSIRMMTYADMLASGSTEHV